MSFADLLAEIENLPPPEPGVPRVPPPTLIGFYVRWMRGMRQLKREALASLAGVSLSTLERVERGEAVEVASLEKIGAGLGFEPGYLTTPRVPLTPQEMAEWARSFAQKAVVRVKPVHTQAQVRRLAECHGFLPMAPEPQDEYRDSIFGLAEWLDLASFMRSDATFESKDGKGRFRELYASILDYVKSQERKGLTILGGVLPHPIEDVPDWKLAVLSISAKATDPGAPKRRAILVDTSVLSKKVTWADCAEWPYV